MFSGSYNNEDVEFLLKVIDIDFTDINDKEKLVQKGDCHYSELINKEYEPSEEYLKTFYQVFNNNKYRFSRDMLTMAYNLNKKKDIVLVSLVRAGTPIGVILKQILKQLFKREVKHYSISIIRDREIDNNAIEYISNIYPSSEIIWIDGWTGKGIINKELKKFINDYNKLHKNKISSNLYVISDIAGISDFSVTNDDYLIPSSALNSTISGLVSRSILNKAYIKDTDFHGCKYYDEYKKFDLSQWFVQSIIDIILPMDIQDKKLITSSPKLYNEKNEYINYIMKRYEIQDINFIKPGIAESTRVLLRRIPYLILVKDLHSTDILHILQLSKEKNVDVIEDSNLPYTVLAIIKQIV